MSEFILFILLGCGAGAAYAILGLGVVAIYKGSGILNFAQGAMAMIAVYSYAQLSQAGLSTWGAALVTVIGGSAAGAVIYTVVIRPLRRAPALAKAVTTIGLMSALVGLASLFWANSYLTVPSLLPNNLINALNATFGANNLWAVGITIALAAALWALYRFTTFGMATRAASENERGVSLMGFSPDLISAGNWALGGGAAAVAGVIIGPILGANINNLTLLVIPALAAALLGAFRSFGLTAAVGLLLGITQSLFTRYSTQTGLAEAVPFVIVIVAMVATGRLIPARGMLGLERPPFAPKARISPVLFALAAAVMVVVLSHASDTNLTALTNSMIIAIIALSLVVVTGFLGQISLAQMAFAGGGAFTAAKLSSSAVPFPVPILVAAVAGAVLGVIVGLPALRVRGLSLAVITLGFAHAMYATVFANPTIANGSAVPVKPPSLWGYSLSPILHPMRFAVMVLIVLGIMAYFVMNLRRSASGQRMLAIRSNERSAAAAGINVTAVKLQGFALAAAIAAVGGALGAYQLGSASDSSFTAFASITLLTVVYIGGIANTSGALLAGVISAGGILFTVMSGVTTSLSNYWIMSGGIGLMVTAISQPDGAAVANMILYKNIRERIQNRGKDNGDPQHARPAGRPGLPDVPALASEPLKPRRGGS